MFIEIADLKSEPLHISHVFGVEQIRFDHPDAALSEPVSADFVLSHKDRDLHIYGTVSTAISFECSRCLKKFQQSISARYELDYLPQPKGFETGEEIELKYDEMEVAYYDGIVFDVNLMVLEQIELAIPMRFVCNESCKGLCYVCGTDLNQGACKCKKEEPDSRLGALLEFRNKLEK